MSNPFGEDDIDTKAVLTQEIFDDVDVTAEIVVDTVSGSPTNVKSEDIIPESAKSPSPQSSIPATGSLSGKPELAMKNIFASVVENVDHTNTSTKAKATFYKINVVGTYMHHPPAYLDINGDIVEPEPEEKTISWFLHHRFSDFDLLHSFLSSQSSILPSLPPKTWWWTTVTDELLEKRRVELNDYLMKMQEIPFVRNSVEMIQFLEVEKHASIDTTGVPRVTSSVNDRNFGCNAHVYDKTLNLLITVCEESDRMARLDSQLSNLRFPWQKNETYKIPLGSLNVWREDVDKIIFNPSSTLFFEQQVSAVAVDAKRKVVWVGLHSGVIIALQMQEMENYENFNIIYEIHMHKNRITKLIYDEDADIVFTASRDSNIGFIQYGRDHALRQDKEVPGSYANREVISYGLVNTNEGWCGSMVYDKQHQLLYVGTYSGKILLYQLKLHKTDTEQKGYGSCFVNDGRAEVPVYYTNGQVYPTYTDDITLTSPYVIMFPSSTTLQLLTLVNAHEDAIRTMSYNYEQECLITGGFDAKTGIWNTINKDNINNIQIQNIGWFKNGPKDRIKSVCLCPSIQSLIVGLDNGMLAVWDVNTAELVYILNGHANSVTEIEWDSTKNTLITSGRDGKVQFWTISPRK